jgi:hypothetical protein
MAEETSGHDASVAIWVAVFVIIAGTIVGGIALIEWNWPIFWVGIGLFVLGSIGAALGGIMDAVDEFVPPSQSDTEQPVAS